MNIPFYVSSLFSAAMMYLFFAITYVATPNDKVIHYLDLGWIILLFIENAIISVSMWVFQDADKEKEQSPGLMASCLHFRQVLAQRYLPPNTLGYKLTKSFLYLVTVPFYFFVTFVMHRTDLLLVLAWARFNTIWVDNMSKYYYEQLQSLSKAK